jgi:hypothetical protein
MRTRPSGLIILTLRLPKWFIQNRLRIRHVGAAFSA